MNIVSGSIKVDGLLSGVEYSHIKVESESEPGTFHYILVNEGSGTLEKCDCAAFGHRPGPCKHMRAVINDRILQRES
jgi:hypothetical protein